MPMKATPLTGVQVWIAQSGEYAEGYHFIGVFTMLDMAKQALAARDRYVDEWTEWMHGDANPILNKSEFWYREGIGDATVQKIESAIIDRVEEL